MKILGSGVPQDMDHLREAISGILSDELHLEIESHDTDLIEDGLLDSLAFMDLLMFLEQRFAIAFSPELLDFENFRSVNRIAQTVSELHNSGEA